MWCMYVYKSHLWVAWGESGESMTSDYLFTIVAINERFACLNWSCFHRNGNQTYSSMYFEGKELLVYWYQIISILQDILSKVDWYNYSVQRRVSRCSYNIMIQPLLLLEQSVLCLKSRLWYSVCWWQNMW